MERNYSSMNAGTIPHLLWTRHICCCWSDCARLKAKRSETSTKLKKLVNGKRISIRRWTSQLGKRDFLFRISVCPGNVFRGTNQKNVYHLYPNRNFREFVVNGKHPESPNFGSRVVNTRPWRQNPNMGSYLHPNMVKNANFRGLRRIWEVLPTLRGVIILPPSHPSFLARLPRWQ